MVERRREQLAALLREQSYLPVSRICERLGVSEATARRDLAVLESERRVLRTYGGALSEFNRQFTSFSERCNHAVSGKRWIGRAAAALVGDGMTVFMDSGTTVYAVAVELANGWSGGRLKVVTNNLPVAEGLSASESCEVHLLGGQFLGRQSVLLGRRALRALRGWRFDLLFFGAQGLDADGAWNSTREIVEFQQAAIERARRSLLCVDRTKFGRRAPAALFGWDAMPPLVTDAGGGDFGRLGRRIGDAEVVADADAAAATGVAV